MYLSQSKAAKMAGVSRGTIANRLDDGLMSRSHEGIELSELMRCFPHITEDDIEAVIRPVRSSELVRNSPDTLPPSAKYLEERLNQADLNAGWLKELVEKRDILLAEKERQLVEAQARLDEREAFWSDQVNKLQALLPAPPSLPAPSIPRKRFLGIF